MPEPGQGICGGRNLHVAIIQIPLYSAELESMGRSATKRTRLPISLPGKSPEKRFAKPHLEERGGL
jgi:hypothetical protein